MATRTASASSSTSTSITPLGPWTLVGPTSSGAKLPRPPPSIMAGPAMPILALRVAMITSQQPSSAALPAKQRPDTTPTSGTSPESRAMPTKVWQSSPATPTKSESPGRPPPPSANSTRGRRHCSARPSMRSVFLWFMTPWVPAKTV
ncbi:hypothetical protein D9M70_493040 [compost metagenome]